MASMDPYCVYDTIQEACVGINSANRNAALQNVTHGIADCPIAYPGEEQLIYVTMGCHRKAEPLCSNYGLS